jgi:hypothetical protein
MRWMILRAISARCCLDGIDAGVVALIGEHSESQGGHCLLPGRDAHLVVAAQVDIESDT